MPQLVVIGAGNMGAAILRGAVARGVLAARDALVVEPDPARRAAMEALGFASAGSVGVAGAQAGGEIGSAEQLLLAVKPQAFPTLAAELEPHVAGRSRDVVVVSIMAGVASARIRALLGPRARVLRAMPNMPCQIGEGMTAVARGAGALPGDEALALRLFGAVGRVALVEEPLMHAVTAVSGSGPAYLFHLAEAMEGAAVALGFEPAQAREFVAQTLRGAAGLLAQGGDGAAALRSAVTSKGGTTEAALRVFAEADFPGMVERALTAARDRGAEMA